ncbi:MAG TPA: radical SAM family heme chaperone HemW [Ferruginibacter sp.]|nr:radical SAM family heme chaperone HemW [Ferruginibacter sp.]
MPGIYIHIPFCKQACHYCNFHFSTSIKNKNELIDAILSEIELTPVLNADPIQTIYFGGGTPSILPIADIERIIGALKKKFAFAEQLEITLEANPDDINEHNLAAWRLSGINRFSIGIQSFVDEELKWMNRAHNAIESLACIDMVRAAGFNNFSIDLIYGSPLLSDEDWEKNIDIVLKKDVPHISAYALTVEPKTALDKMIAAQRSAAVDPEKQARQFLFLIDKLNEAGYEHYEISNFAKPGLRSNHNSSYWKGDLYYGFGPSAHAFDGNNRRWNVANNALYIQSIQKGIIPFEEETLTTKQRLNEYIMTSLRTVEGIDLNIVEKKFGKEKRDVLEKASGKWRVASGESEADRKMILKDAHLILTREGKLFADGIASDLFFD